MKLHRTLLSAVLLSLVGTSAFAQAGKTREQVRAEFFEALRTGDIIVHVFRPEIREFYNIERMWAAPDLEDGTLH